MLRSQETFEENEAIGLDEWKIINYQAIDQGKNDWLATLIEEKDNSRTQTLKRKALICKNIRGDQVNTDKKIVAVYFLGLKGEY